MWLLRHLGLHCVFLAHLCTGSGGAVPAGAALACRAPVQVLAEYLLGMLNEQASMVHMAEDQHNP
jgi:hypothetical protein